MIKPERLELPWREPVEVARQLAAQDGERGLIWLDGDGSELGHRVTIASAPSCHEEVGRSTSCRVSLASLGRASLKNVVRAAVNDDWAPWEEGEAPVQEQLSSALRSSLSAAGGTSRMAVSVLKGLGITRRLRRMPRPCCPHHRMGWP